MAVAYNINGDIANTYILTNRKLTAISALGVMIGISIFIFMNSMVAGFDKATDKSVFRTMPHIRIYKDEILSKPLSENFNNTTAVIINPHIVPESKTIVNPNKLINDLKQMANVVSVAPEVNASVFFNIGKSQLPATATGIITAESDAMFNISSLMVEGTLDDLKNTPNGIIIGGGLADKLSAKVGDNLSFTSSRGITKVVRVTGIFLTNNSKIDNVKTYINIHLAQQLLKEGANYISDINVNITDNKKAIEFSKFFSELTGYKAESWQEANATLVAGSKMRKIIIRMVSISILLVAGFGIYNILNMTITSKINDIAILKAMGFKGRDIVRIFVRQALTIGAIGVVLGMVMGAVMVNILAHVYVGGDIGYFPIQFEPKVFLLGMLFGLFVTFMAGFIPARKAGDIDPVAILRK